MKFRKAEETIARNHKANKLKRPKNMAEYEKKENFS